MKKSPLRSALAVALLVVILGLFAYYIHDHPTIITHLRYTSIWLILLLLGLYGIMLIWWMNIYNTVLSLCDKPLKNSENLLLTIYSTLANFFLPLQSGPGVRAAYLKKRHKVPISSYLLGTLLYLGIYAIISAGFLFVAYKYWWLMIPSVIVAAVISYGVIMLAKKQFEKKQQNLKLDLSRTKITKLVLFTLGQVFTQVLIFGLELNSLHLPEFTIRRVFSYTGAANFSLFVSLTPGAIGFREAFLEFSRSLHHFTTNAILAANIIDRGVFLIFLGCLLIIMLITHAKRKLKI